ncbi:hypothetical protein ABPG75_004604, partial [Micractinium tetrahymenae]
MPTLAGSPQRAARTPLGAIQAVNDAVLVETTPAGDSEDEEVWYEAEEGQQEPCGEEAVAGGDEEALAVVPGLAEDLEAEPSSDEMKWRIVRAHNEAVNAMHSKQRENVALQERIDILESELAGAQAQVAEEKTERMAASVAAAE